MFKPRSSGIVKWYFTLEKININYNPAHVSDMIRINILLVYFSNLNFDQQEMFTDFKIFMKIVQLEWN